MEATLSFSFSALKNSIILRVLPGEVLHTVLRCGQGRLCGGSV